MVDATVTLYKDIGLDSNFNRTMLFTTKIQQTAWFNNIPANKKLILDNVNYNKVQNSFYIHEQVGDIYGYTYVKLENIDDSGRIYYGFISNVTLVDDETSRFNIVIDPIQTFMTEWELGECMVAREHVDRWTTGSYPIIRTLKEGAVGNGEVDTEEEFYVNAVSSNDPTIEFNAPMATMIVIFTSEVAVIYDEGTRNENRVFYGVIPISLNENKSFVTNIKVYTSEGESSASLKPITADMVLNSSWLSVFNLNPDAVIGAYICNPFPLKYVGTESDNVITGGYSDSEIEIHIKNVSYDGNYPIRVYASTGSEESSYGMQVLTEDEINELFNNYASFDLNIDRPHKPSSATVTASDEYEPMMYMQPFRYDYIVDSAYTPLIIIPDQVKLSESSNLCYSTIIKTTGITEYLFINEQNNGVVGASAMVPTNTVDVLSDAWKSYCLTQRDSDRRMMWNNIISNVVNNAVFMGYGGALVGSRSASGDWDDDERRNSLLKRGAIGATSIALGASLITSVVQGYGMWVEQEAKEQTIRNQPSTLTAQSDGVSIAYNPIKHVSVKMNDSDYNTAYDKFKRYGYMVNKMENPNIQSRYYYNYICTTYTTVKGSLPADIKQDLVNIFEKGITFFHADHCSTTEYPTYENIERSLIS